MTGAAGAIASGVCAGSAAAVMPLDQISAAESSRLAFDRAGAAFCCAGA
ncbi:hypothetical protein ACRAVF_24825 [Bradyrhizobium oligotrophicum S58]